MYSRVVAFTSLDAGAQQHPPPAAFASSPKAASPLHSSPRCAPHPLFRWPPPRPPQSISRRVY